MFRIFATCKTEGARSFWHEFLL